jgi:hypothetical protein
VAIGIALFLAVAAYAGWYIGQQTFYGGWGNRLTHSCGWFKDYIDWPKSMQAGKPCPSCGKVDKDWYYRVGRPVFPFGWEWQDDRIPVSYDCGKEK